MNQIFIFCYGLVVGITGGTLLAYLDRVGEGLIFCFVVGWLFYKIAEKWGTI